MEKVNKVTHRQILWADVNKIENRNFIENKTENVSVQDRENYKTDWLQ